jgi:hypothetical protein
MDYLDEIAENSNTWNGPSPLDSTDQNRSNATTSGGSIFKLREEDNLSAKISLLTKEIKALKLKGSRGVNAVFRKEPMEAYWICQEIDHTTSDCKSLSQFLNVPKEQVCTSNQYRSNNSSYSNNYNPNMRNHPYLSYKSDNVLILHLQGIIVYLLHHHLDLPRKMFLALSCKSRVNKIRGLRLCSLGWMKRLERLRTIWPNLPMP